MRTWTGDRDKSPTPNFTWHAPVQVRRREYRCGPFRWRSLHAESLTPRQALLRLDWYAVFGLALLRFALQWMPRDAMHCNASQ